MVLTFQLWTPHDTAGENPSGRFSRTAWLPIIGPTSWLIWGSVADLLRSDDAELPDGCAIAAWDSDAIARAHGLRVSDAATAPLRKSLARLSRFRLFEEVEVDPGRFLVRCSAPPLTDRQLDRSSPHVATLQRQTFREQVAS